MLDTTKPLISTDELGTYTEYLKEYLSKYTDVVFCATELERESIPSPSTEKIYIVLATFSIYVYTDSWKCLTSQEAISEEYINSLFVADEQGALFNDITPISDSTINDIWDSVQ